MDETILVVDDEPDILKTIAIALELDGYKVDTAATGTEAVNKIMTRPPDLLIIDVVIPGMSGRDIARWIKNSEKFKAIPIILITALAQKREQETLEEEGIDYYLIKPFDLNKLTEKVKELLHG